MESVSKSTVLFPAPQLLHITGLMHPNPAPSGIGSLPGVPECEWEAGCMDQGTHRAVSLELARLLYGGKEPVPDSFISYGLLQCAAVLTEAGLLSIGKL